MGKGTQGMGSRTKTFQLEPVPSRKVRQYMYCRFVARPNENRGHNDHLGALFSYLSAGAGASSYVNHEIGWNKYRQRVYIDRFLTAFPVAVEKQYGAA